MLQAACHQACVLIPAAGVASAAAFAGIARRATHAERASR